MPYRLAILVTHPIQYQVPLFRRLAVEPELDVTVLYCGIPDAKSQGHGFGIPFQWDIPLLEGYNYDLLENLATNASLGKFSSYDTPAVGRRIEAGRFDAVLVSGWNAKSYVQGLKACRKLGIPCLVRGDSNALRPRAWWKRWLLRHLLRKFSAYLIVGRSNADFYRDQGASEARFFLARHFVENERFAGETERFRAERDALRRRWALPPDRTTYLFCGKFIPYKRAIDFLRALKGAAALGAPLYGLLVGDGELRAECEQFARANALPVTFAGFLNQREIPTAYVASDCIVLPSDYGETWGLVVNEGMACGLPALVSDRVGCGPDLIVEGKTGMTFPFGDYQALARLLAELAQDPAGLVRMGQAARRHVEGYSVNAAAQGIVEAVRFVCSDKRGSKAQRLRLEATR